MRKIFMIIFVVLGGVLGCALGEYCLGFSALKFLGIGAQIGFVNPLTLDFSFLSLTLGFTCKINVAGILFLILFAFLARKVASWLKI